MGRDDNTTATGKGGRSPPRPQPRPHAHPLAVGERCPSASVAPLHPQTPRQTPGTQTGPGPRGRRTGPGDDRAPQAEPHGEVDTACTVHTTQHTTTHSTQQHTTQHTTHTTTHKACVHSIKRPDARLPCLKDRGGGGGDGRGGGGGAGWSVVGVAGGG